MSRSSRRFSINDVELPPNLVKGLSVPVLKEVTKQDEATFYQFFEGLELDDIKRARDKTQQLRETNQDLAVKNVELEPKFKEMKAELMQKTIELNTLKEEYDKRFMELKAIEGKMNHQAVEKELAQAAKKVEKDSEDLASDFVNGKLPISLEEFREQYVRQRTLYWLRKVKLEKMKELLMNYRPTPAPRHSASSTVTPPYPSPLHSLPAHQQPHSPGYPPDPVQSLPPYPQGQSAMPAPGMPSPGRAGPFAYTPFPKQTPNKPTPYVSGSTSFNQHRF